jgi:lysozyme
LVQNEFDALVSFVFNIGAEAFRTSRVLVHLNAGEKLAAAEAMAAWRKAKIGGQSVVVDGLVRRRSAEKDSFFSIHQATRLYVRACGTRA